MKKAIVLSCMVAALLLTPGKNPAGLLSDCGKQGGGWALVSTASASEANQRMLPRWREGGTPYDSAQSLSPYSFNFNVNSTRGMMQQKAATSSPSGIIESPPEYAPVKGVLIPFILQQRTEVVRDVVVALTADPQHDEIAYVVVRNDREKRRAAAAFKKGGADMSKVAFIVTPADTIWMRDYGPHFIMMDGALGIVDSQYYPGRPNDNFAPTVLGEEFFHMPTSIEGLYHSGGNFQAGPDRSGFVTSLINLDNPKPEGFDETFIAEQFQQYHGIDKLHVMPQLPPLVDGTGHIDMWMYLVDNDSVVISEFKPGSDETAISITNNAVEYMKNLGFEVYRAPAWNQEYIHYTYTNGFRVNDRIFIPSYGKGDPEYRDEDEQALAAWQAAAGPGVKIIPIDCYSIIPGAGALHCIVKQVPRYSKPAPSVSVVSPAGGELLVSGTEAVLAWAATDTDDAAIPQIDLYYSIDGGGTYEHIATTDDSGTYKWPVPAVRTKEAKIKVVATSADSDKAEAVSSGFFEIAATQAQPAVERMKFGNFFALGYLARNWSQLDKNRTPLYTDIRQPYKFLPPKITDFLTYKALQSSDATNGDYDLKRYRPPAPGQYNSTHVFEFTIFEDPAEIDDIGIAWEGYGDDCVQMELYVWDYVEQQWGDGKGLYGQNRFMDNWAGNRDGVLDGHIRSDFERYLGSNNQLTLLVYAERAGVRTFHDYVSVVVSQIQED